MSKSFSALCFGLETTPSFAKLKKIPPLRWSAIDHRLRGLILAAGCLALASAPEAFLILWANDQGLQIAWIPLIWAAASGVKSIVAGPAGVLSDRCGRLPVLLSGWTLRIATLLCLAWSCTGSNSLFIWPLFLTYAASLAATEGAERALIGDFAKKKSGQRQYSCSKCSLHNKEFDSHSIFRFATSRSNELVPYKILSCFLRENILTRHFHPSRGTILSAGLPFITSASLPEPVTTETASQTLHTLLQPTYP